MPSTVGKLMALAPRRRRLLFSACWHLGRLRAAIAFCSFKWLARGLVQHPAAVTGAKPDSAQRRAAGDIAWAVRTAARRLPWASACLVQALAAQRMLQKEGIHGAMALGALLGGGQETRRTMEAHAWVRCGDDFVTGQTGHERFTVVSTFTW